MADKIKLLLVEDERTLAGIIRDTLSETGFEVSLAYDGEQALEALRDSRPDIVVTDIMMPVMDGFTLVEHLRRTNPGLPVIFLSARSSADDVVRGFGLGAGDYLRKPFAMSELVVRIQALLGRNPVRNDPPPDTYLLGRFRFDPGRSVLERNGERQVLSGRESELLHYLVRNRGRIVPTRTLLVDLWGDDGYFNTRSLHVFITKLRRRLSDDPSLSIVNVRGTGYKLLSL